MSSLAKLLGGSAYLWEIHTESAHVQSVEEATETLVEAIQALVQELQVHKVCFQIGHTVAQLCKGGFQRRERIG